MILQLCVGVLFMRAGQRNCKQHNLTATFRNCTQHPFVLSRLSARIVKKCSKEASLISVGAKAFASAHETYRETFLAREQFFFPRVKRLGRSASLFTNAWVAENCNIFITKGIIQKHLIESSSNSRIQKRSLEG